MKGATGRRRNTESEMQGAGRQIGRRMPHLAGQRRQIQGAAGGWTRGGTSRSLRGCCRPSLRLLHLSPPNPCVSLATLPPLPSYVRREGMRDDVLFSASWNARAGILKRLYPQSWQVSVEQLRQLALFSPAPSDQKKGQDSDLVEQSRRMQVLSLSHSTLNPDPMWEHL